jgi:Rod binding domain-containing protein
MEIPGLQSQVKASVIPFDQLASNPNVSQSDKVKEACKQFEAVLLRQILGEARKTVIKSSMNKEDNATSVYNDLVNNQMADSISRSGAFGLAKSLQAQLVHQILPRGEAAGASSTPAAVTPVKTLQHK